VKTFLRLATLVAGVLIVGVLVVRAQGPVGGPVAAPPRPGPGGVALIDVTYIFKNHVRFKQAMDRMKEDAKAFEAVMKNKGSDLNNRRRALEDQFRQGTPEYKRQEEILAREAADLNLQAQLKKKEILEQEAKVYYNVYREIQDAVAYHAQRFGLSVVIRHTSDPIDPQDRASVMQGITGPVVYYQRDLDITGEILQRLNPPPNRQATGQPPPPGSTVPIPRESTCDRDDRTPCLRSGWTRHRTPQATTASHEPNPGAPHGIAAPRSPEPRGRPLPP
jgi:Skp family chaperone for outer membrane proteins